MELAPPSSFICSLFKSPTHFHFLCQAFKEVLYLFKVYSSLQARCFSHLFSLFRFSTVSLSLCIISFIYYNFYSNFEIHDVENEYTVKETAHEIEPALKAGFLPP